MWISTETRPSFGFLDGISNPAVTGFDTVIQPGPSPVQPGVIVTGKTGDPGLSIRKDWSTEGSFAVFRFLKQLVPEFNEFLIKNPIPEDGNKKTLTPAEGSALLGARMVGRWKSGAPIDVSPFQDDPVLAADPTRYILTSSCKHPALTNWLVAQEQQLRIQGWDNLLAALSICCARQKNQPEKRPWSPSFPDQSYFGSTPSNYATRNSIWTWGDTRREFIWKNET